MISVIIPIYNSAEFLPRCIDSVMRQTYTNLQVILIDDGSTDSSTNIAEQYAAQDKRIVLIKQANRGQAAARNEAMKLVKGDYLCFVDSDDWIDEDFLITHLNAINGYDIVQSGYKRVQDGKIIKTDIPTKPHRLTSASFRLYRTQYMMQHGFTFVEGHVYEDILFSVDIWLTNPRTNIINYAGYNYRLNPASTTSHPHDTTHLYKQLHLRLVSARSLHDIILILSTIARVRMHFFLKR